MIEDGDEPDVTIPQRIGKPIRIGTLAEFPAIRLRRLEGNLFHRRRNGPRRIDRHPARSASAATTYSQFPTEFTKMNADDRHIARCRAEQRQRAIDRARAIAACDQCDEHGYIGTWLCHHDPGAAERARRGRALVDEVMGWKPR